MKKIITSAIFMTVALALNAQVYKFDAITEHCIDGKELKIFHTDVAEYYGYESELEKRAFKSSAEFQQKNEEYNRLKQEIISSKYILVEWFVTARDRLQFNAKTNRFSFLLEFTEEDDPSDSAGQENLRTIRAVKGKNMIWDRNDYLIEMPVNQYKCDNKVEAPEERTGVIYDSYSNRYKRVTYYNTLRFNQHCMSGVVADSIALKVVKDNEARGDKKKIMVVCKTNGAKAMGKIILRPIAMFYTSPALTVDLSGNMSRADHDAFIATVNERYKAQAEAMDIEAKNSRLTAEIRDRIFAYGGRGYAIDSEVTTPARIDLTIKEPDKPTDLLEHFNINRMVEQKRISSNESRNSYSNCVITNHYSPAYIKYPNGEEEAVPVMLKGTLTMPCKQYTPSNTKFQLKMKYDSKTEKWLVKNRDKLISFLQQCELTEDCISQIEEHLNSNYSYDYLKGYYIYLNGIYQFSYDLKCSGAIINNSETTTYTEHKEFPMRFLINQ